MHFLPPSPRGHFRNKERKGKKQRRNGKFAPLHKNVSISSFSGWRRKRKSHPRNAAGSIDRSRQLQRHFPSPSKWNPAITLQNGAEQPVIESISAASSFSLTHRFFYHAFDGVKKSLIGSFPRFYFSHELILVVVIIVEIKHEFVFDMCKKRSTWDWFDNDEFDRWRHWFCSNLLIVIIQFNQFLFV